MHLDNFLACEGSCPNSTPLVHLRGSETRTTADRRAAGRPILRRDIRSRVRLSAKCSVSSFSYGRLLACTLFEQTQKSVLPLDLRDLHQTHTLPARGRRCDAHLA